MYLNEHLLLIIRVSDSIPEGEGKLLKLNYISCSLATTFLKLTEHKSYSQYFFPDISYPS